MKTAVKYFIGIGIGIIIEYNIRYQYNVWSMFVLGSLLTIMTVDIFSQKIK